MKIAIKTLTIAASGSIVLHRPVLKLSEPEAPRSITAALFISLCGPVATLRKDFSWQRSTHTAPREGTSSLKTGR
jgi:hypothetical protein